ncbi:DUF29 family protein [Methylobacterium mesophilicum]|uniref:DUF29 family protein n=1 Tax=Methylobacterium mesophilicum TaxID=39956 RepID=UPI001EE2DAA2|nr:DUF29 family protein [Methylobacterium mesophilicum]GJE23368.1 hypothetical protein JHFBIEKO_3830 [Methylobacterium mesophilicum]
MSLKPSVFVERVQPAAWGEALAWERQLLGAVLGDPSLHDDLRDLVAPEDFSTGIHERLFEAVPRITGSDGSIERDAIPAALGAYAWDAEGGVEAWLDRLLAERAAAPDVLRCARDIHANAERRRDRPELIDEDTVAWCHQQVALLTRLAERSDPLSQQIDWQNIVGELLYVGRSQTSGVVRKMELVFEHLVKLLSDPDAPSRNRWRIEIDAFLLRIAHEAKPSMRRLIDLDAAWRRGVADAAAGLAEYAVRVPRDLPQKCPFTYEDLTGGTLPVTALLEKLAATGNMNARQQP